MKIQTKIVNNEIFVNGVKLTKEQSEKILNKNVPYLRAKKQCYYYINECGVINSDLDLDTDVDNALYANFNYFLNFYEAKQIQLHQLLYRKLFKYAQKYKAEDCEWDNDHNRHYYIYFDYKFNKFMVTSTTLYKNFCVYFSNEKVAEQAIEDIIKPFVKRYTDFTW